MSPTVPNTKYNRTVIYLIVGFIIVLVVISIWGTYTYSPTDRTFYIFYVLFSISSILLASIVGSFLLKPISDSLLEETHKQIEATNKQIEKLANSVQSFRDLGIVNATIGPSDYQWALLIRESTEIKLVFKSSVRWLLRYEAELSAFLLNPAAKLYILLPDTNTSHLTEQLAIQRNKSQADIVADVERAKGIIAKLHRIAPERVQCKLAETLFVSHFYIFPQLAVVTIRAVENGWKAPHFFCENNLNGNNSMYSFCHGQFEEFWDRRSTLLDLNTVDPAK